MYDQIKRHRHLLKYLLEHWDRVIHLKRRSYLDSAISKYFMEHRKVVHSDQVVDSSPVTVNVQEIASTMLGHQRYEEKMDRVLLQKNFKNKVIDVYYEDLVSDLDYTMRGVFSHISVSTHLFPSKLKKVGKQNHWERITNFNELLQYLTEHRVEVSS